MKRVTAQRMVIRHLHFVNDTGDESESDIWDEQMFANVSNGGDGNVIFNISDSDEITLEAESSLNSMDESQEAQSDLEYENVLPESNDDKAEPESKNDEPCDGNECTEDETEDGTWPASRPLRRSSLTLVSDHTHTHTHTNLKQV